MKKLLNPCLWFDENAKDAADFYCSIFENASIELESKMLVTFQVAGYKFTCLNGGPQFKGNPSISFYYVCETLQEFDFLWAELQKEGKVLMPVDNNEFSQRYGWVEDKFNISWQLTLGKIEDIGQKITPCLMFTGNKYGKAEKAIEHYTSIFRNSDVDGILHYGRDEAPDKPGAIKHAQISLNRQKVMVMESNYEHDFTFNEAISFVINCKTQAEIDYYWGKLARDGKESVCGWLRDRYGISWQVLPVVMEELLMGEAGKAERVVQSFLKMKKIEIEKLTQA
jgi:predicted 3-demethylubiquinone-9 3-methyltransferase (glyoxalase superfamily)